MAPDELAQQTRRRVNAFMARPAVCGTCGYPKTRSRMWRCSYHGHLVGQRPEPVFAEDTRITGTPDPAGREFLVLSDGSLQRVTTVGTELIPYQK